MHPSIDPFSRSDMSENIKRAKHVRENQEQNRKSKVCAILGNPDRRCIVRDPLNCRDRYSERIDSPKESRTLAGACLNGCRFADR